MTTETSNARGWDGMPTWRKQKPTRSGVYGVRGFNLGDEPEDQFEAIVAVRLYGDELVCNLHESTSEADFDNWMLVSDISEAFEWCEFAAAPPPAAARGDVRGLDEVIRRAVQSQFELARPVFGAPRYRLLTGPNTIAMSVHTAVQAALAAEGVQAGYDTHPDWYARREQHAREMGYTGLAEALADLERRRGEGVQAGEVDRIRAAQDAAIAKVGAELQAEQRARELLAQHEQQDKTSGAPVVRRDDAIRAIVAALSQQPEARGVVGELVQMGDDEDGHPRLIINTTREAIKASNLVPFSQVEVRNG
jgi:hypothetical protein